LQRHLVPEESAVGGEGEDVAEEELFGAVGWMGVGLLVVWGD